MQRAVRRAVGSPQPQRLRIEVDSGIAPSWPHALFNVIRAFAHAVWFLARQLDVDEQNIWDSLDGELFATATFGYRARRRGKQTVEFATPDSGEFYTSFAGLSGGEQTRRSSQDAQGAYGMSVRVKICETLHGLLRTRRVISKRKSSLPTATVLGSLSEY